MESRYELLRSILELTNINELNSLEDLLIIIKNKKEEMKNYFKENREELEEMLEENNKEKDNPNKLRYETNFDEDNEDILKSKRIQLNHFVISKIKIIFRET